MIDLRQLCSLPVAEKLKLVEDLWDSIAEEPGELRLDCQTPVDWPFWFRELTGGHREARPETEKTNQ